VLLICAIFLLFDIVTSTSSLDFVGALLRVGGKETQKKPKEHQLKKKKNNTEKKQQQKITEKQYRKKQDRTVDSWKENQVIVTACLVSPYTKPWLHCTGMVSVTYTPPPPYEQSNADLVERSHTVFQ
jgi:hypothetical protein